MGCKKPTQKHKKGFWSPDEDLKLKNHIMKHGHGCWSSIPINAGLERNGKSCRLRWINYLRPGLKRGAFSFEEEEKILALHQVLGNKWSQIAYYLHGRTDNEIKNYWHSYLKKRVSKLESISSSTSKSGPKDCSFQSLENMEGSSTDHQQGAEKCILPKLLFAEWLSLDLFNGSSSSIAQVDCGSSNSEDSSAHGEILGEFHSKPNFVCVDDMLQSAFGFEDQISESGLVDYFQGVFDFCCDELYV